MGGDRDCQTGVRVLTGGNGAEQEEHWGEPGSSTRGFAWLLEEMGRNKKNTGGSQGMPNGVRLSAGGNGAEQEEQWGRGTANTGGNQHKTGWGEGMPNGGSRDYWR